MTVFDFAEILERTEKRVQSDLLGAGPKSVAEMRAIFGRNRQKYTTALDKRERGGAKAVAKQLAKDQVRVEVAAASAAARMSQESAQPPMLSTGAGPQSNEKAGEPLDLLSGDLSSQGSSIKSYGGGGVAERSSIEALGKGVKSATGKYFEVGDEDNDDFL